MRFIFLTMLTAILVVFLNAVAPYWIVMIGISILSALLFPSGIGAFMGAGLGMGLTWIGQCIYLEITTSSPLPDQMGELMGIGSGTSLIFVTGLIGFLLGGFSGLTGILFRKMFVRDAPDLYEG